MTAANRAGNILIGCSCPSVVTAMGNQPYARGQALGLAHLHLFGDLRAHAAQSCAGSEPHS
eukprot:2401202-Rhodomonas_salina.1